MALLLDDDYENLAERGITFVEDEGLRAFIFTNFSLSEDLYTVSACDVLVIIPANYNQAGNDMFWTFPRLERKDGQQIPNSCEVSGGDNRTSGGRVFCRWSRHWNEGPGVWRSGRDDIISIHRRIVAALKSPG